MCLLSSGRYFISGVGLNVTGLSFFAIALIGIVPHLKRSGSVCYW